MDKPYKRLPIPCDFSYVTVAECLSKMLPADCYEIHAGRWAYYDIKTTIDIQWHHPNPFTPPVNVVFDDSLGGREWYINPIRYAKLEDRNVDCWGTEGI